MSCKVPMVILPPGVGNQVETKVVIVNPTIRYHEVARNSAPGDVTVEDVRVIGTAASPEAYIVETARADGTTIPLVRIQLLEEAIRKAKDEIAAADDEVTVGQIKAALNQRIAELFLPEDLRIALK